MSLDSRLLQLLMAKDSQQEAQFHDDGRLLALEAHAGWQLWQQSPRVSLSGPLPIGSSLPFSGQFWTGDRATWVLVEGARALSLTHGTEIALPGLSTDLVLSTSSQLSWISEQREGDAVFEKHGEAVHRLWQSEGLLRSLAWHPARRMFAALAWEKGQLPWHAARLMLWGMEAGVIALAPPGLEDAPCFEFAFSPSGENLAAAFLTDDHVQIWFFRLRTRNWTQVSFDDRDRSSFLRRSGRRSLAFRGERQLLAASVAQGFWQLEQIDWRGEVIRLPSPFTSIQRLTTDAARTRWIIQGSGKDLPPQMAECQLQGEQIRWVELRHEARRLQVEAMTWAGEDGSTVHGLLYRDPQAKGPLPLLMPLHGGPGDAAWAGWADKAQAFVQQGYAVLYVNGRGSAGYGGAYHHALAGRWPELAIQDAARGAQALVSSGLADARRVALWGGGVASLQVLLGLDRYPEIFTAGIAVFPILDLEAHRRSCSSAERWELDWALGARTASQLEEISGRRAFERLKRPLCLFAGAKDSSLDQAYLENWAEKPGHAPLWLKVYADEGRVFRRSGTYEDYYSRVAGFLDRFVKFRSGD